MASSTATYRRVAPAATTPSRLRNHYSPTRTPIRPSVRPLAHSLPKASRYWRSQLQACTVDELLQIITAPSGGYYVLPKDPYNEVYPQIYISDGPTALCTNLLKRMGITHVLNAAMGKEKELCLINTSPAFYKHVGIKFHGVEALDHVCFHLDNYFEEAANFIQDGVESKGKVLVHCRAGISRSATLVLAFLMLKKNLSVQEALRTVRSKRAIIPNDGFLRQLCELDDRLNLEKACSALTLM